MECVEIGIYVIIWQATRYWRQQGSNLSHFDTFIPLMTSLCLTANPCQLPCVWPTNTAFIPFSVQNIVQLALHRHSANYSNLFLYMCSKWVMMNKVTRKLARIPDEVRTEIEPYFFERSAIVDEDNRKLPKLPEDKSTAAANYVRTGLTVS